MTTHRPHGPPIDGPESSDARPAFDAAGVDLTLVRDALAMTPAERLAALTLMMASIARLGSVDR
jgi:hypothetical protein